MKQPWVMTCSDGSDGHPRKYGIFPRKVHEYVYENHVLSLQAAVRSSTSLPAKTLQIKDRGLLKPGDYARCSAISSYRRWSALRFAAILERRIRKRRRNFTVNPPP